MFINHRIYTDIESYRVLEINGTKGRAIQVKKNPVGLESIPGGFAAFFPNQHEAYRNSNDVVEVGEPFNIELRNGVWGRWTYDGMCFYGITAEGVERQMAHSEKMGDRCEAFEQEDGTFNIRITFLTPKGNPRRKFVKLGVLEDECRYFYNHAF